MLAIGLMSGTSLDGVDCSLVDTDGVTYCTNVANIHLPYSLVFQRKLQQVVNQVINWYEIESDLTELHAQAVEVLLTANNFTKQEIDIVGFHGQTIYHNPSKYITWQIGNPHMLAKLLQINVVSDFRRRDVAYGGQGAPLVPIFHECLMSDEKKPVAVLNIGGVANVSYIDDNQLLAFDVGCGNALINDAMLANYNLPYDDKGIIATKGVINKEVILHILKDEFFASPIPKSLDRNYFKKYDDIIRNITLPQDQIATLTALTVECILKAIKLLPHLPKKIFACGGGVKNQTIMNSLNQNGQVAFLDIAHKQLETDFIESQAFAYLAVRYLQNLPTTFPGTTGVNQEISSGVLFAY